MVAAAPFLAACGSSLGPVNVTVPTLHGRPATACAGLVDALPTRVAGQTIRSVTPTNRFVAAWGDPPIVLTCSDVRPHALQASSSCFRVNGVDWLVTSHGAQVDPTKPVTGPLDFTTVGRSSYVDVRVPDAYQPAANALVDVAPTVKAHTQVVRPCR